jgi:hypothetical protein
LIKKAIHPNDINILLHLLCIIKIIICTQIIQVACKTLQKTRSLKFLTFQRILIIWNIDKSKAYCKLQFKYRSIIQYKNKK